MYWYTINGWAVESDYEFMQLTVLDEDNRPETPDLLIIQGEISDRFSPDVVCFTDLKKDISLFSNSYMYMVMEKGTKLTYQKKDYGELKDLNSFFIGWGMATIAFQKGETAIHCSALADETGAILVTGDSGSGKSTLTTYLLDKGYSFMADDISVVKKESDGIKAYPAFPYQKLCRNVVNERNLDLNKLIYINEQKDKFLVPFEGTYIDKGMPVKAIIFLTVQGPEEEFNSFEETGINKFLACINAMFLTRLDRKRASLPDMAAPCLDIAGSARILIISRPQGKDTQALACKAADDFLASL